MLLLIFLPLVFGSTCDVTSVSKISRTEASACPPSKYVDSGVCKACPSGYVCNGATATLCTAGTHSNSGVCTSCPSGYWSPAGSSGCAAVGFAITDVEFASAADCSTLPLGKTQDDTGKACVPCHEGEYQDQSGRQGCKTCPSGYFTPTDTLGRSVCPPCDAGKYQDQTGQALCTSCPSGKGSPAGSLSCTECLAGEYADGDCKSCLPGWSSLPGSDSCVEDGVAYGSSYSSTSIFTVCNTAGKYQTNNGECLACSNGKYLDQAGLRGSALCKLCAVGKFTPDDGDGRSQCVSCPNGWSQAVQGSGDCSECQAGTYSERYGRYKGPKVASQLCPENGKEEITTYAKCQEATTKLYPLMSVSVASGWNNNDPGGCWFFSGASEQVYFNTRSIATGGQCDWSGFSNGVNTPYSLGCLCWSPMNECESCNAGQYQDETVQSACDQCPGGWVSSSGSSSCSQCSAGWVSSAGSSSCSQCSAGTYSSAGSSSCSQCSPGWYSAAGWDSCSQCGAGMYSDQTGCVDCSPGWYSAAGWDSCSQCGAGMYSDQTGCVDCSPGWISSAGSSTCSQCPAGRYSNAGTGCVDCPEAWTSAAGSSSSSDCVKDGQYTRQLGYANVMAVVGQSNFHSPAKCKKAVQNHFNGATTDTVVVSSGSVPSGCTGYWKVGHWTYGAWEPHLNTYSSGHACGKNSAGSYADPGRYWCVIPGDYSVGGAAVDGWGCVGATYAGTSFCSNLPGWDSYDITSNSYKCCVADEHMGLRKCAEGWFHHAVSSSVEICMGRNANGFLYNP